MGHEGRVERRRRFVTQHHRYVRSCTCFTLRKLQHRYDLFDPFRDPCFHSPESNRLAIRHSYEKDKKFKLDLFLNRSIIRPNFRSSTLLTTEDKMRKPILASILLTFGLIAFASGQGTTSRVTGTIQDANGAAVAGAA